MSEQIEKQTTTWYEVDYYSITIKPVDVLRETSAQVVLLETDWQGRPRERRAAKVGSSGAYFSSEDHAAADLIRYARERVAFARRSLEIANSRLGNLKGRYPNHPAWRA